MAGPVAGSRLRVRIAKLLWRGRGLARLDSGQVVMVEPGVLPGEDVLVRIVKATKDYLVGVPEEISTPSLLRRPHPCAHAHLCGGSRFGMVSPADGLKLKTEILRDALTRALPRDVGQDVFSRLKVVPSPQGWRYRWRGQIHVRDGMAHAMEGASNDLVALSDCHLLATPLAQAMPDLAASLPDGRFTIAASPVTGQAVHEHSQAELEFYYPDFDLRCTLPPGVFFQANQGLNQVLVREVVGLAQGLGPVADLFSGAGNFSLPLACRGIPVLAVEGSCRATQAGQHTAQRLGLGTARFVCADLARPAAWSVVRDAAPRVILIDPPRTGAKGIGQMLASLDGVQRLVWVSCDVVNTLRDARPVLDAGWQISSMQLFDMFPGTWHMEVLMVLERPVQQA
ncbi:MAG: class I SAM-dependent RNA methyltransferase [Desulfovibrionales bacterium]|nr:class I SAM-dependent RNA methyltransferase [Desulfovibrionales bacterium]